VAGSSETAAAKTMFFISIFPYLRFKDQGLLHLKKTGTRIEREILIYILNYSCFKDGFAISRSFEKPAIFMESCLEPNS
jgi:hypothetical protein